jgi:hypothetical protein
VSIVACVKVYDGVVLGSESMTQLFAQPAPGQPNQFIKAFGNARKLFGLTGTRFGVLTYGAGNIGKRSIESYLTEFDENHQGQYGTGEEIAKQLMDFIRGQYDAAFGALAEPPVLGFYVAGYSPGQHTGTEWEFTLTKNPSVPIQPRPDDQFGASWRGISVPFTRLHFGVDPRVMQMLQTGGVPAAIITQVQNILNGVTSPVVFDGMPLQDAIGFCRFIIQTTIGVCAYEAGVPSCGGPIHIAAITKRDGFVWISEPKLSLT